MSSPAREDCTFYEDAIYAVIFYLQNIPYFQGFFYSRVVGGGEKKEGDNIKDNDITLKASPVPYICIFYVHTPSFMNLYRPVDFNARARGHTTDIKVSSIV